MKCDYCAYNIKGDKGCQVWTEKNKNCSSMADKAEKARREKAIEEYSLRYNCSER